MAFSDHLTTPSFAFSSFIKQRKKVVLPAPFSPITASFAPASKIKLPLEKRVSPSKPWPIFSSTSAWRCSFLTCFKLIDGLTRLEDFTSSRLILSIRLARELACLALEALAEKRLTNACNSSISALFFEFSVSSCSRIKVDAATKYS